MKSSTDKIAIGLTPEQRLRVLFDAGLSPIDKSAVEPNLKGLAEAFDEGNGRGLITLAQHPEIRSLSPTIGYWLDFAEEFMRHLASTCDEVSVEEPRIDYDHDESETPNSWLEPRLDAWIAKAPPMEGGEYLSPRTLESAWGSLANQWANIVAETNLPPRRILEEFFPRWADVGKVHFHLAENRKPNGQPFVFLATYTTRSTDKARVQHRPIGLALKDALASGSNEALIGLLKPIERAARHSDFLQNFLESRKIYQPQYLTPLETHRFLTDIPKFESAGIICKIPDFWKQRHPPRAKIKITIGTKPPTDPKGGLGLEGLVDFNAAVSLGDKNLSPEELRLLLDANSPLVQLNGQWVEVNTRKLQSLIDRWDQATRMAGSEGLPLGQALRLIAGFGASGPGASGQPNSAQEKNSENPDFAADFDLESSWTDVVCGDHLAETLRALRAPGEDIDPEVQRIIDREINATLRPYQTAGVGWLYLLSSLGLGGCLADDMGLGKTLQLLCLLVVRKFIRPESNPPDSSGPQARTLLILPASLIGNWLSEIQKFAPSIKASVLHPSYTPAAALATAPKTFDSDLYITTYGMLTRSPWMSEIEWGCVVADEAQAIKNADTKQSRAVRSLKSKSKFALTGTPVENHLGDLWTIFDFVCPGLLGSQSHFANVVKSFGSSGSSGFKSLRTLISPYLLRRNKTDKKIISDLPDKIEVKAICDLSLRQTKLYQERVDFLAAALKSKDEEGGSGIDRKGLVLSSLMKLKQICNHPSQYENDNQYLPRDSGKFEKLKELVETIASKQERLLVFTQFKEITDVLQHYLSGLFRREGLVLHGGTEISKRKAMVDKFQQPDGPPFFVLSLKAGGTGLNLTKAQHVIHFDRWWNPAVENQATDRAFRIGQKSNVIVHKFICRGTLEEKIDAMIDSKKLLADTLVEGGTEIKLTELSNEELLSLIRLDITTL